MAIPWVWRPQRWERKLLVDGQLMPWIPNGLEMMQAASLASGGASRTVMLRLMSREPKDLAYKRYPFPWDFAKILLDTMLTALENQRGCRGPSGRIRSSSRRTACTRSR
jgi:hypothetical protein